MEALGHRRGQWTPDRVHALYRLWVIEDRPAREIAARLGTTRGGVIGKAHRMSWSQGMGYSRYTAPPGFPEPKNHVGPEPEPEPEPEPIPEPIPAPVLLSGNQCHAPGCRHTMQPQSRYGLCAECNHARLKERSAMGSAAE